MGSFRKASSALASLKHIVSPDGAVVVGALAVCGVIGTCAMETGRTFINAQEPVILTKLGILGLLQFVGFRYFVLQALIAGNNIRREIMNPPVRVPFLESARVKNVRKRLVHHPEVHAEVWDIRQARLERGQGKMDEDGEKTPSNSFEEILEDEGGDPFGLGFHNWKNN